MREQEAWGAVARHVADQHNYIRELTRLLDAAESEARGLKRKVIDLEAVLPNRKKKASK